MIQICILAPHQLVCCKHALSSDARPASIQPAAREKYRTALAYFFHYPVAGGLELPSCQDDFDDIGATWHFQQHFLMMPNVCYIRLSIRSAARPGYRGEEFFPDDTYCLSAKLVSPLAFGQRGVCFWNTFLLIDRVLLGAWWLKDMHAAHTGKQFFLHPVWGHVLVTCLIPGWQSLRA